MVPEPVVLGPVVDDQTRCVHYHGPDDVIAIRFRCCGDYYPCYRCHQQTADHPIRRWPRHAWERPAVLCGLCRSELTVAQYLASAGCPRCGAAFNERCWQHHHIYFELGEPGAS